MAGAQYEFRPDWKKDPGFYDDRDKRISDPVTRQRYQEVRGAIHDAMYERYRQEEIASGTPEAEAGKEAHRRAEDKAREVADSCDWKAHKQAMDARARGEPPGRGEIVVVRDFERDPDLQRLHRYERNDLRAAPASMRGGDCHYAALGPSENLDQRQAIDRYSLPRHPESDQPADSAGIVTAYHYRSGQRQRELAIRDDCAAGSWQIRRQDPEKGMQKLEVQHRGGGRQAIVVDGGGAFERDPVVYDVRHDRHYEMPVARRPEFAPEPVAPPPGARPGPPERGAAPRPDAETVEPATSLGDEARAQQRAPARASPEVPAQPEAAGRQAPRQHDASEREPSPAPAPAADSPFKQPGAGEWSRIDGRREAAPDAHAARRNTAHRADDRRKGK